MTTLALESHDAIYLGKQSVIATNSHVVARMEFRSPLTDQDASGIHFLPGKTFHAKTLSGTIPSVSRAADTFLMGHDFSSPSISG
jgi:hypothetical protein